MQRPYKNVITPMGIYAIRNLQNAKVFVGWSLDVNALLNRSSFELEQGSQSLGHVALPQASAPRE